ncbi:MAG: YraN family protein [Candidatus Magasanikbacteria bacterium]|nr:YraN family protein [Candidatus Magasanikbacteria bacterium]
MAAMSKKTAGQWGEDQAVEFLKRHGFVVIDRNFQTTRGEIDIVAKRGGDFYFVEVKTREAGPMATDLAVTPVKQRRFKKTVGSWCVKNNISDSFGLVCATLMVVVNKLTKKVSFRLVAWKSV